MAGFLKSLADRLGLKGNEPEPDAVLQASIQRMGDNLRRCRLRLNTLAASQSGLKTDYHQALNRVTRLRVKAMEAAARGDDEQAKMLLRDRKRAEARASLLEKELGEHKAILDKLAHTVTRLEDALNQAKRRRLLLQTQRECYEAQRSFGEPLDDLDGDRGFLSLLEDLEDDVLLVREEAALTAPRHLRVEEEDDLLAAEALALPEPELDEEVLFLEESGASARPARAALPPSPSGRPARAEPVAALPERNQVPLDGLEADDEEDILIID